MHLPERLENEQKSGAIFVDLLFSAGLKVVYEKMEGGNGQSPHV